MIIFLHISHIKHLSWAGKKGKRNKNSQQNKLISHQNKYAKNNFERCCCFNHINIFAYIDRSVAPTNHLDIRCRISH